MTTPTDEEINRCIAEFMGNTVAEFHIEKWDGCINQYYCELYTESLDSLIPVVEKLNTTLQLAYIFAWREPWSVFDVDGELLDQDKSPSRALARAIYEVIRER